MTVRNVTHLFLSSWLGWEMNALQFVLQLMCVCGGGGERRVSEVFNKFPCSRCISHSVTCI